jgi:hypothetical protein
VEAHALAVEFVIHLTPAAATHAWTSGGHARLAVIHGWLTPPIAPGGGTEAWRAGLRSFPDEIVPPSASPARGSTQPCHAGPVRRVQRDPGGEHLFTLDAGHHPHPREQEQMDAVHAELMAFLEDL